MKKFITTLAAIIVCAAITAPAAIAGPEADKLGTSLADNTTGKDRKDLARWIFSAMKTHQDIQNLSKVTDKERDELDRIMGAMVTRLLTENCKMQAQSALNKEGSAAFESAFGLMG